MAVIEGLICTQADGTISFGNYQLAAKSKVEDFEHNGDMYKVKTFREITKLERNGMFVYESVPGTTVRNLQATEAGISFQVEGPEDAQITLGLEDETEYRVDVDGEDVGHMKTNLGGKLNLSVEMSEGTPFTVKIEKNLYERSLFF